MVEDIIEHKLDEIIVPLTSDALDEIDKERALKEWRKTLSYYSLNPWRFQV